MHNKKILHVEDDETTQLEVRGLLNEMAELIQVSNI